MRRVERATVVTHGVTKNVDVAIERLRAVAQQEGVELLDGESGDPDLAVGLGGDGRVRCGGLLAPTCGDRANFGRVGFLTAIRGDELEQGIRRVFGGEYDVVSLPTLEVELGGTRHAAVNDAVIVSGAPGRIIEISYSLDGEDLGTQPCDGLLCATPPGSTAYNLSNGGPVLVWGLEAAVLTFVAPHTLHARPLVVGPDFKLEVVNRTPDVEAVVLADGRPVGSLATGDAVSVRFGSSRTLLATLPEQTFFHRYAQVFGIH
jgi:NAD+ kinase